MNDRANTLYYQMAQTGIVIVSEPLDQERAIEEMARRWFRAGDFLRPMLTREPPALGSKRPGDLLSLLREGARASGSGLGLAIARELAERMDGRLSVEALAGRTTFTLELPA